MCILLLAWCLCVLILGVSGLVHPYADPKWTGGLPSGADLADIDGKYVLYSDEAKSDKIPDIVVPPVTPRPNPKDRTIKPGEIPSYVTEYCPVVHLYTEERYLPYDIARYVTHFTAKFGNGTNITTAPLEITQLSKLPKGIDVYLTATSDFDKDPPWITGERNIPTIETGETPQAPATLIVVDKGSGWVDAFWFYFYSFNLGPFVMGTGPFGDHVGDWEHSLVRFYNGVPQILWMSAHGGGAAYHFNATERLSTDHKRPVIFSARGTHANYASVGQHSHDIPYSMLSDFTDRGPLWDPAQNHLAYTWDGENLTYGQGVHHGIKETDSEREKEYGDWLLFEGCWGDKMLSPSDPRQKWSPFEWKYIDGPTGPLSKNLERAAVCERNKWWNFWGGCRIRHMIDFGEGIESEGGNCARELNNVRPMLLQVIVRFITWRGWGCYLLDRIYG